MVSTDEIEQKIREIKPILKEEFMVDQIGYFGSFARGDYREDSDVNIIVDCKRGIGSKFLSLKNIWKLSLAGKWI